MASLSIYKLLYQQTWFYELKIVYEWPKKNQHYYPNCVSFRDALRILRIYSRKI